MIKIIDYKKVDMTLDEWQLYENICKSYDSETFQGALLFEDLFETDEQGIIIFLKPPTKKHSTLQVFLFLSSLMQQQHLRLMHQQVNDLCNKLTEKLGSK
jgi:hypothetical protein